MGKGDSRIAPTSEIIKLIGMDILYKINSIVKNKGIPDFQLDSYSGINLLITGSHDFCYYHELEIEFEEVSY